MTARLSTLLIWAAVAAAAVYFGLRLFTRPTPVPAGASVAVAALPAAGKLQRLLGAPPVAPLPAEGPAPVVDSRFRLVGVVAPRSTAQGGLALISVDGKPPRAWAVGRELEPGLRLLSVSHRQAELGAVRGAPAMLLSLPPLAEAQRGRPGQTSLPGGPVANTMVPGGMPTGMGLPRVPGSPGGPGGQMVPGMPIVPQGEPPEPGAEPRAEGHSLSPR